MQSKLALYYRRLACHGAQSFSEHLLLSVLIPFGWLYGAVNLLRAGLYRRGYLKSYRSPVPVISVGNLAVGGTGKTPIVDYLLQRQHNCGRKVAVVSRGYGGEKGAAVRVVCAGDGPLLMARQCGDEPYLLALRNPKVIVIVAPQRAAGIRYAVEHFCVDVVVLDDGYQHLAVQRDLDIMLLDSRYPLGNGYVLPAGLLREFPCAVDRADLCIMTRCAEFDQIPPDVCADKEVVCARQTLADIAYSLAGASYSLANLRRFRCVVFAGIANPNDFFASLEQMGVVLQNKLALPDHCNYSGDIIEQINALACAADILLTTEKDAVKLDAAMFNIPCCSMALIFELQETNLLDQCVEDLFETS